MFSALQTSGSEDSPKKLASDWVDKEVNYASLPNTNII